MQLGKVGFSFDAEMFRWSNNRNTFYFSGICFQSSEIQFYGATTLHTKLMKHWHEVPKENRDELKQKLFQTIILFANGPKVVLNRLCIAVSGVALVAIIACSIQFCFELFLVERIHRSHDYRDSDDHWRHCDHLPKPTNAKCFAGHTTMDTDGNAGRHTRRGESEFAKLKWLCALLNIWFQSQVMFASVQRAAVRNEVCKRTPFVINLVQQFILSKLDQTLSDNDMSTLLRAVKCAESWLK